MPKRTDIRKILIIGAGPIVIGQACEFDYSGTQACKAPPRGRLQGHPRQLQPGHDHDRPRDGRPDLHRADHPRGRRADHRRRAARCLLPTLGGQTGLNVGTRPGRERGPGEIRLPADRGRRRGDPDGRGPRPVQDRDGRDRPGERPEPPGPHARRGPRRPRRDRPALRLRPSFTMGGSGGGIAYNRRSSTGWSPSGSS